MTVVPLSHVAKAEGHRAQLISYIAKPSNSNHQLLQLNTMALPLPSGLVPSEVAFLCEMELVTVVPRQRLDSIDLLSVSASQPFTPTLLTSRPTGLDTDAPPAIPNQFALMARSPLEEAAQGQHSDTCMAASQFVARNRSS
jgi:hypothetical protein